MLIRTMAERHRHISQTINRTVWRYTGHYFQFKITLCMYALLSIPSKKNSSQEWIHSVVCLFCVISLQSLVFFLWLDADPSRWSCEHVQLWLQWAVQNFSFEGVEMSRFEGCTGADLLQQGRDSLLQRAPLYVGDILWEHLEILQKGSRTCWSRLAYCASWIGH